MTAGMGMSYLAMRDPSQEEDKMVEFKTASEVATETPGSADPASATRLIRMSGLALLVGSVVWFLAETAWGLFVLGPDDPSEYPQPLATILWIFVLVGLVSILIGVPGLQLVQAGRSTPLGAIGFVTLVAGLVLMAGLAYFGAFLQAPVADLIVDAEGAGLTVEEPAMVMVGYLAAYGLHFVGWLLFGISALRARVLPRWPVALAMAGSLLMVVIGLPLVAAAGVVWLGVSLVRFGRNRDQMRTIEVAR